MTFAEQISSVQGAGLCLGEFGLWARAEAVKRYMATQGTALDMLVRGKQDELRIQVEAAELRRFAGQLRNGIRGLELLTRWEAVYEQEEEDRHSLLLQYSPEEVAAALQLCARMSMHLARVVQAEGEANPLFDDRPGYYARLGSDMREAEEAPHGMGD